MQYVNFHVFLYGAQSTGLCTVVPNRVWTCHGKVIGVAEGKQPLSRPTLLGRGWSNNTSPMNPSAELQHSCSKSVASCITTASSMVFCTLMNASSSCGMTKTQPMEYSLCQRVSRSARSNQQSSSCCCLWDTWRNSMLTQHPQSLSIILAFLGQFWQHGRDQKCT